MRRISIIPYVGGKYGLLRELVPIIEWCADTYKLTGYLEICAGGARQLLNISPTKFAYRLYNDKDLGLCRLFKCLEDSKLTISLMNKLLNIEYNEENFRMAKELYDKESTGIVTSAAYTFILACQSRAADMKSFDRHSIESNRKKQESLYYNRIRTLSSYNVILNGVDIKNEDALDILEQNLERDDYFVAIDPPYVQSSKKSINKTYKHDNFDHAKMVDLLLKTKTKVMLSGYNNCYYDRLDELNGWHKIYLKNKPVSIAGKADNRAHEFIWINFDVPKYILGYSDF